MDKELIKLIMDLGVTGGIAILVILLAYKYASGMIDKCLKGRGHKRKYDEGREDKIRQMTKQDLLGHEYFSKMRILMTSVIPQMEMNNKDKRDCAIEFLLIKFRVFIEVMQDFCWKEISYDSKENGTDWLEAIQKTFITGINRYEEEARRECIPELFIADFNVIHSSRVNEAMNMVTSFSKSGFLANNAMRTWLTLDMLVSVFNGTILDVEHTMNSRNGELDQELKKWRACKL